MYKSPFPIEREEALKSFYAPFFPEGSALNRIFITNINTNVYALRRLSQGATCSY